MKAVRVFLVMLILLTMVLFISVAGASSMWNFTYDESGDDAFLHITYQDNYIVATGYSMGQYPIVYVFDKAGHLILDKTLILNNGAMGVASTLHDGYIYTTGSVDGSGGSDVFLAKVDIQTGKTIYIKTYRGNGIDEPRGIVYTPKGIVIVGNSNSTSDQFPCSDSGEGFIMLVSFSGDIIWNQCIPAGDYSELNDVYTDGQYIYTVGSVGTNFLSDILTVKLDTDGNIIWQKTLGGKDYDYGYGITGSKDGIYIAGTTFSGELPGFHGKGGISSDGIIALLDKGSGNTKWIKLFGGSSDDELFDISYTFLGPVAVGYTTSKDIKGYSGGEDNLMVSITDYGKLRWQKAWGGSTTKEEVWSVASSPYNIFFTAGWTYTGKIVMGNISGFDADGKQVYTNYPFDKSILLKVWDSNYLKGKTEASMGKGVFPFIDPRYSRSLVPIRFVAEGLGYKVDWDSKDRIVTISGNGKTIKLYMKDALGSKTTLTVKKPTGETIKMTVYEGSQVASVDGRSTTLSAKPLIYENRTFVPIRFVSETLGSTVKWIPPDGIRIIP